MSLLAHRNSIGRNLNFGVRCFVLAILGLFICFTTSPTALAEIELPKPATTDSLREMHGASSIDSTASPVKPGIAVESIQPMLEWVDPQRFTSSMQLVVTMTVVGLVPALLLMTTSYVRISIVLSMLRQAFGAQALVPTQATTALAVFCTALIMWPTWMEVHRSGIAPLVADSSEGTRSVAELQSTWNHGIEPVRQFMARQIDRNGNWDDVHVFLRRTSDDATYPAYLDEVPLRALLPGFLLSELKTAFLIGFQIYLPFLVIDLVVASLATSLGMFMLPPAMVSLPLKLMMFVMVDGWHLIIEMLLDSFV